MAAISFDPARQLTLYFRVARDGSKTFSFVDANGTAKDVSGYSFAFSFKYRASDSSNVFSIANGDLTRPSTDKITIPVSSTLTNVAPQEYYWQMDVTLPDTKVHTWLTGSAKFHNGEFDGIIESSTITVDESGSAVTIAITDSINSYLSFNRQTDDYTLALSDNFNAVETNKATANTITVPPSSSVAFPIGSQVNVLQYGAGQTTIAAGAGVTLRYSVGLKIVAQYDGCTLTKVGTDEWYLNGALEA